jgi:serine/threonine protein kinase
MQSKYYYISLISKCKSLHGRIKLLGEGSFGRVYLMREKKHRHRLVCVKEIRTVNMNSKERQSCRMEGEMMKKLHHPNVIRYFGAFESSNHSNKYIVMEYCSGGDLRQFLKISFNSMNENKICYWFIQICLGLEHMHRNKIMHRDIKSQNIFISNAGFLVLGDLGIARDLQQDGFAQTVIGTPVYMSPEVFDEKSYDLRSDIWALGCVLYEMCTGTPPFVATTTPALINNICNGRFTPLSKYVVHRLVNSY